MRFLALENDDPSFNWRVFKFPADLAADEDDERDPEPARCRSSAVQDRGGKLLLYHGWSDPAISAYGTVGYYEQMSKIVGGQQAMDAFAKLYLVPGMHHCTGGPGPNQFDMLTALENWVEKGQSPGPITRDAPRE